MDEFSGPDTTKDTLNENHNPWFNLSSTSYPTSWLHTQEEAADDAQTLGSFPLFVGDMADILSPGIGLERENNEEEEEREEVEEEKEELEEEGSWIGSWWQGEKKVFTVK